MFRNFAKKPPKSEQPSKSLCTFHAYSKKVDCRNWLDNTHLIVVSIDPGIVNFGFRIEKRPYKQNVQNVEVLAYCRQMFSNDVNSDISYLYSDVTDFLDAYKKYYDVCHIIIIEKQLAINHNTVRLSQHIITYFISHFKHMYNQKFIINPTYPLIIELDAKYKTNVLHKGQALNEKQVKEWAIQRAQILCRARQDQISLNIISSEKKKDDLCDTIVQIEAVCSHYDWGQTVINQDLEDEFKLSFAGYILGGKKDGARNLQQLLKSVKTTDTTIPQQKVTPIFIIQ